jgi:hypothetical protein
VETANERSVLIMGGGRNGKEVVKDLRLLRKSGWSARARGGPGRVCNGSGKT